jgi:hypothetical protein
MLIKSGSPVANIARDAIPPDFSRAEVRLEGLKPPVDSFELRFFAGLPKANAETPTSENPHYLASQFFYGLGVADDQPPSTILYDVGRASQSAPTQVRVNITSGLRKYLQSNPGPDFLLTVVAVDRNGNEIADPDLDLDGVSIESS